MNTNLRETYKHIRNNHRKSILDGDVQIEALWNNDVWGVNIQIELDDSVVTEINSIQTFLCDLEKDSLYYIKDNHHLSVVQVVAWNGIYNVNKKLLWTEIKEKFIAEFKKFTFKPFTITFKELIPTSNAIILCAYDNNGEFQQLRHTILEKLPVPIETYNNNSIIHTTIARYSNKLEHTTELTEYCDNYDKETTAEVTRLRLIEELVYPTISLRNIF